MKWNLSINDDAFIRDCLSYRNQKPYITFLSMQWYTNIFRIRILFLLFNIMMHTWCACTRNRLNRLTTKRLAHSQNSWYSNFTTIRVSKKKFQARAEFEAVWNNSVRIRALTYASKFDNIRGASLPVVRLSVWII